VDRRRQLLEVALALFDERGVEGTTMRELAKRAGVNVALPYHHFDSKQDLLRAIFEELGYLSLVHSPVDPQVLELLAAADPEDSVALVLEAMWDMLESGAAYFRLIHVQVLYGDHDAKAVGEEMWRGWGDRISSMLDAIGVVDGALAPMIRALLWGLFNETRLTGGSGPEVRQQLARRYAHLIVAGAVSAVER
jgi:AcrR family transcriptional regulator